MAEPKRLGTTTNVIATYRPNTSVNNVLTALPFILFGTVFIVVTAIVRRRLHRSRSPLSISASTYGIGVIIVALAAAAGRFVASWIADAIILIQAVGADSYLHGGTWIRFVYRHEILLSNGAILGEDVSRLYNGIFVATFVIVAIVTGMILFRITSRFAPRHATELRGMIKTNKW